MKIAKTYRIETERLVIRCYHPKDAEIQKQSVDESIEHLLPWMPWAKNEPEEIQTKIDRLRKYRGNFDLGIDYVFGIFDKAETMLIGSTGLHTRVGDNAREIGYWINVNQQNKGYATETVKALTKVGFEIEELERIQIHCTPENIKSQKIPRKLGYTLEGTLKKRVPDATGNMCDIMVWTMFKEDYPKSGISSFKLKAFDEVDRQLEF